MSRRRALAAACLALVVHACAPLAGERAESAADPPERPPPPSVASLVERAEAATANGDDGDAIEAYAEALERTPWNTRLEDGLANAYARRAARARDEAGARGLPAAEADLRRALELRPDDTQLRSAAIRTVLRLAPCFILAVCPTITKWCSCGTTCGAMMGSWISERTLVFTRFTPPRWQVEMEWRIASSQAMAPYDGYVKTLPLTG